MAIRSLLFTSKCLCDSFWLHPCILNNNRFSACFFSTAAEQHNAGDDFHGDDSNDDESHSITHVRMLEMRASKLKEQVRDITERYKRALADSDNVRRRTQKFVEDAKLFGIQSFCRDLVEVADLLEQTAGLAEGSEAQRHFQGLKHIQGRLQDVFTKHGLEKMNPVGGTYDPYQHDIACRMPAEGVEPGTITVVKQNGYTLHGRTIRHAHVAISVKTQE
ncbi:grpE protein homolog 2, mitochondrial [Clupea harengus]|uniref:GrpE protein homolog 2, mitochondrial n=1 Tax=Clupea harengus TaxID=7950 RepID=A0A6P8FZ87_CLUHA|nr:grpE protein homolog 2, mitochondrial [Clupea harengus]